MSLKVLFLLLINVGIGLGQSQKIPIAVIDLDASGVSSSEAKTLTDRLSTELFSIGTFDVMERDKMAEILQEQGFQLSGIVSTEHMIEAGELIGVRHIVAGSIAKLGSKYLLNVRVVDVKTGKILAAASEECTCPLEELTGAMDKVALKLSGVDSREKITIKYSHAGVSEQKGNFYIKSIPSGAAVYLNRELQDGVTPLIIEDIPVGIYAIRLESGDYAAEISVKVGTNEFQAVDLKLVKNVGRLRVITNVQQADVYLNGQFKGKTPLLVDSLSVGDHGLKVKKTKYLEYFRKIKIKTAKETVLDVELKKPGPVKILSVPLEANVYIDGEKKGITPIILTNLDPGEHKLELRKEGYKGYFDKLYLKTDEEIKIEPVLESEDLNQIEQLPQTETEKEVGTGVDKVVKWVIIVGAAIFTAILVGTSL